MVSREQVWRVRPTNWRSSRAEAKQKTTLLKRMVRRPGMGLGVLVVLHVAQALHIVCHARAASGARARAARRARRSIGGRKRTARGYEYNVTHITSRTDVTDVTDVIFVPDLVVIRLALLQ